MPMLRHQIERRRGRGRRGVGIMWFALVSIPVLLFCAGLAVDLTRVVVAHREASNLASAAAVAGSYQFKPGKAELDPVKATAEAKRTWIQGRTTYNAARLLESGEKVTYTVNDAATARRVNVHVEYKVTGLVFLHFFTTQSQQTYHVDRSAFVCVPGVADPSDPSHDTDGFCTRPRG
jgi:Flp pilus assembly protein TadG